MNADVNAPQRMEHDEKTRLRRAAFDATRIGLGPAGEMVSRELLAWEEFGWRLADHGLVARVVGWVEAELRRRADQAVVP